MAKRQFTVMISCILMPIMLAGCQSVTSRLMPKTTLYAFLDGDQAPKKAIVVEEITPIIAEAPPPPKEEPPLLEKVEPSLFCTAEKDVRYLYRRKIGVIGFALEAPKDSVDFPHITHEYPHALKQFIDTELFLVTSATHRQLWTHKQISTDPDVPSTQAQIIALAQSLGVQFILAGTIENMSVEKGHAFYSSTLNQATRHLVVSTTLYDGTSGLAIKRQRFAGQAEVRQNTQSNNKTLNSNYLTTTYGITINDVLKKQGHFISTALDCIPMQANIVAVNRDIITLDIGIESLLMPGDTLQLYQRINATWPNAPQGSYRLERYGKVTITESHSAGAQATLQDNLSTRNIFAGDAVQAW